MRMVFGLVLLVGIALAGGAVYLAKDRIAQYQMANARAQAALAEVVPTQAVFVAANPLKYGQKLTKDDIRSVDWPENAIPEGAFTDINVLFPENTEELRVVLRTIEKDEALMAVKLTEPGQDTGLTSRLARGMRAFTISVDVSSGVSGFLRPGDRVDVYWTGRVNLGTGNAANNEFTKLIEAGVQLIAVDQTANDSLNEALIARTVTVAVSPQQVAGLAQAQSTGRLSLALVGAGDETVASAIQIDQRALLGIEEEEEEVVEVVEEKETCFRTERRGTEIQRFEVACTN
ncbi:MAG: Flp pilus assembly protein CpaB [Pseudomonadota bacterium]